MNLKLQIMMIIYYYHHTKEIETEIYFYNLKNKFDYMSNFCKIICVVKEKNLKKIE